MVDDKDREADLRKRLAELDDAGVILRIADTYAAGDKGKIIAVLATVWDDYHWLIDQLDELRDALKNTLYWCDEAAVYLADDCTDAERVAQLTKARKLLPSTDKREEATP